MFLPMEIPEPGPRVPRRGGALRAALGRTMLRMLGWRIGPGIPDLAKAVIITAPHSSNWDFPIGIAVVFRVLPALGAALLHPVKGLGFV